MGSTVQRKGLGKVATGVAAKNCCKRRAVQDRFAPRVAAPACRIECKRIVRRLAMPNYAAKLTFGPEAADWQERFNPDRMRRQRVERAQMLMRKYGIAALLEANHHNIRYLTALKGFAYPMCRYVLFFAEHDPVMYEHNGYYHQ